MLAAAGLLAWQLVAAGPAQARPGDLDPSFGVGGKVTTDFSGTVDEANALVVQPDGKLVAAGWTIFVLGGWHDFALTRYNPDGSLDPSFSTDGKASTDFSVFDEAHALVLQADGKLVAAGRAGFGFDFGLVRYHPDGTRDASFGSGGRVTTDFGGFDQANALVVQPDGKLVAAGSTVSFTGGEANSDFALARYNPDGSLDASFGRGGRVTTDFGGNDEANALVVQADGKLVAAGSATIGSSTDFALARYNPNGTPDASFGSGGRVTTNFAGGADEANALAVQPGGRLVAAGSATIESSTDFALARYRRDGALDRSFGTAGKITTDFAGGTDQANDLVRQGSRLVAAGLAVTGGGTNADFALARYKHNGSLDRSFGSRGRVTTDFAGGADQANALVVQADRKLVAAGFAVTGSSTDFALARYQAR